MVAGAFHQHGELAPGNGAIEERARRLPARPRRWCHRRSRVWPRRSNLPPLSVSAGSVVQIRSSSSRSTPVSTSAAFDCRDTARGRQEHRHGGRKTGSEGPPLEGRGRIASCSPFVCRIRRGSSEAEGIALDRGSRFKFARSPCGRQVRGDGKQRPASAEPLFRACDRRLAMTFFEFTRRVLLDRGDRR